MPIMRTHESESKSRLRVPQTVVGKKPLPLIHSCPVIPKCYQSDDSFELQQTMLSINESYSHTESSDAHNAEHIQFDKEKFMRLVLTEDWASIF